MTNPGSRPVPLVPWDTWQDKLSTSLLIGLLLLIPAILAFSPTFDIPISRQASTCRLKSWAYWQPEGNGGDNARIAVKCALPGGKVINLSQPVGWQPPDVDSEIKIKIVNYRLSGPYYYAK